MKKSVSWQIDKKDIKEKNLPITFNVRHPITIKMFKDGVGKNVVEGDKFEGWFAYDLVKADLLISGEVDNLEELADKKLVDIKSATFTTKVPLRCCDCCEIGSGVTSYPNGRFQHTAIELITFERIEGGEKVEYELCPDCYDWVKKDPSILSKALKERDGK